MKSLLGVLALAFLALFAGIWIWIGWKLWHFSGTPHHPKLDFSDAVVTVAGFVASAVGAGTASVLGIEIQKVKREQHHARRARRQGGDDLGTPRPRHPRLRGGLAPLSFSSGLAIQAKHPT